MLLVGFPVHEFMHAWTAYRLGDNTARWQGRLTLDPRVHFDPVGGLMLADHRDHRAHGAVLLRLRQAHAGQPHEPRWRPARRGARRGGRPAVATSSSQRSWRSRCGSSSTTPEWLVVRSPSPTCGLRSRSRWPCCLPDDQHLPVHLQPDPDPAARRLGGPARARPRPAGLPAARVRAPYATIIPVVFLASSSFARRPDHRARSSTRSRASCSGSERGRLVGRTQSARRVRHVTGRVGDDERTSSAAG